MDAFSTVAEHDAFERGGITPAAFRDAVRTRLHLDIPDDELDAGWCSIYLDVYPGMEELLTELGHTRRLAAFTNTNLIHEPVWRKRYAGILRHFEPIFCSHLIGARKPEPEAYGYVLAQLGVEAHNVTFLDDNLANVTAARACGIDAIHVSSQAAMLEELHARGLR